MGSHPYFYFTKYQPDINLALQQLRQQEFEAGRYDPAMNMHDPAWYMFMFKFPPTEDSVAPGAKHPSIEAACDDSTEDGTGSILDIEKISDSIRQSASYGLSSDEVIEVFNTDKPTRETIEALIDEKDVGSWSEEMREVWEQWYVLLESIGRGECRHIILYDRDEPSDIFFVGYSWD
ncbi:MAG: hypothetical protein J7642_10245 [Cyanobacteria bacterium SBC]|nr:hypothetical protein [Cyanobacteria bacterium SBC]